MAPWRPPAVAERRRRPRRRDLSWAQALRPGAGRPARPYCSHRTCWGWAVAPPWWPKVIRGHVPPGQMGHII